MQGSLDAKGVEIKIENPIISSSRICPICRGQMEKIEEEKNESWGNTSTKKYIRCLNPECGYQEELKSPKSPTYD